VSIQDPLYPSRSGAAAIEVRGLGLRWPSLNSVPPQLALAAVVATTLLISVAAAHTPALLPQTIRPAPSALAGAFAGTRIVLGTAGLFGALGVMLVCYFATVARAQSLSPRVLVTAVMALHVVVLLGPPLFSTDMFSYQAYGRMGALYGLNPYLLGPHAAAADPTYGLIGWRWVGMPTVYGPVFTALSYLLAPLSVAAAAFTYKGIAALASLSCLLLVWRIAGLRGLDPRRAVALTGLNPLVVLYGVGGGHNDLLMMLPVLAGVYLVLTQRERSGGALMITSAAIKITGGLPLAFALAAGGRLEPAGRRRLLVGALAAVAVLAGLAVALFGLGWLRLPTTFRQVQSQGAWDSFVGVAVKGLGLRAIESPVALGLGLASAAAVAWLLSAVWRGRMNWLAGSGWAAVALLCCATSLLPWYLVWVLPLAGVAGDRRLWRVSLILTVAILVLHGVDYLPSSSLPLSR